MSRCIRIVRFGKWQSADAALRSASIDDIVVRLVRQGFGLGDSLGPAHCVSGLLRVRPTRNFIPDHVSVDVSEQTGAGEDDCLIELADEYKRPADAGLLIATSCRFTNQTSTVACLAASFSFVSFRAFCFSPAPFVHSPTGVEST